MTTPASPAVDGGALAERIALRAFLKWQERGGDEISNWLEAEREVNSEAAARAYASSPR